jgi:tetratricopeptide (TPR) repeat protein
MDLLDIIEGRFPWSEYVRNQGRLDCLEKTLFAGNSAERDRRADEQQAVSLPLAEQDYAMAVQSGLGALGAEMTSKAADRLFNVDLRLEQLAGGVDRLNADFHMLLGDVIWRVEMRQETLDSILQEIRLAEFEREARAYRRRAERAYLNGWYEESLGDFLEAEKRNYPDFAVLRSIASIYLYHLIDLPKALEYFRKAAKYSLPSDARQSAEANFFAGMVCVIERKLEESALHLGEASHLNPRRGALPASMGRGDAGGPRSGDYAPRSCDKRRPSLSRAG